MKRVYCPPGLRTRRTKAIKLYFKYKMTAKQNLSPNSKIPTHYMNNQHGVPTWSGWFEFSKVKYEAAAIKYILIMRLSNERYTCSCLYSFSSFEPRQEISNKVVCAISKGSDQPVHTRSLIRAFISRLNIL